MIRNQIYGDYWSHIPQQKVPKSIRKTVFSIDKRDRHSLWLLMKSGVNLVTLADMLESKDTAQINYALDIFKNHSHKLGKYLESKFRYFNQGYGDKPISEAIIRRIKNIQKL